MASIHQSQPGKKQWQEKEDAVTQAETFFTGEDSKTLIERVIEAVPSVQQQILNQHSICSRISAGTFSADKILRLISSLIKLTRTCNLIKNLKPFEKIGGQIGQLRRLLRFDRVLIIFKEYSQLSNKKHLSRTEAIMAAFKGLILIGDICDIFAYLIKLNIFKDNGKMAQLRKYVANIYFIECLGWLVYHSYLYLKAEDEEDMEKNKMMVYKYIMDALTSQNDSTIKVLAINPKVASLISVASSLLNLSLVWR